MTLETSKDQKYKQTSFQEDFLVNLSQSQVSKEERMMTATSGMKLLELLPKQNQGGLLAKMLTELLTSPMVQSCSRYKKIWKPRVSKSNVLLFQLAVSVHGIKEKESGSSDTMYPTPTAGNYLDVCQPADYVERNSKGWTVTRKKTGTKFGAKLNDVVNKLQTEGMYPTPTNSEHKYRLKGNSQASKCLEAQSRRAGGKLNPNFVEFLMGYPTNYTQIEPTELKHLVTL